MTDKSRIARRKYLRRWRRTPTGKESTRLYRLKHPEKNNGESPEKRKSHLKTRYGITDLDYYRILAEQGGGCAVCSTRSPNNGKGDRWFDVDHDHETGKVRGLLCRNCNLTLGVLERKRSLLLKLEVYLVERDARRRPLATR